MRIDPAFRVVVILLALIGAYLYVVTRPYTPPALSERGAITGSPGV